MSNTRTAARPKTATMTPPPKSGPGARTWMIVGGLVVVIVAAAILAVVFAGGSSGPGIAQQRDVQISGAALTIAHASEPGRAIFETVPGTAFLEAGERGLHHVFGGGLEYAPPLAAEVDR